MDYQTYRQVLAETQQGSEVPFTADEFARRRAAVRTRMEQVGFDALLLTDPSDVYYLTGYHTFEVSVHACLVVTQQAMVLQVPSIETGPAVVTALVDEIVGYRWESMAEVVEPLCQMLSSYQAVGLDTFSAGLRYGVLNALQERLGESRFRAGGGEVLDAVRIIKSPAELDCLRESARLTSLGLRAAESVVRSGATDNEVAAEGARAMLAAGGEFMSLQPIVTTGPRIGTIHVNHKRYTIEQDQPIFLEFGSAYQRYTAPMMRTAVAGRPSYRMQALAERCHRVYHTLCDTMRPGHTFGEAARAAQRVLSSHSDDVFFSGVFGYAVGAQFPPSWVEGTGFIAADQDRVFEADMVFHLPLCFRLPGQWGIGLSDTVRVAPGGAEALTDNDWKLSCQS